MAVTIDRAERLTNLLALLLSSRQALTADGVFNELAGQYPAGAAARRQAFERDKASLRDIGVPIETEVLGGSDAGRTAYRIDRDRYELRDLELAADETRALQAAVAAIRSGTPMGTDALLKLGAGAPDAETAVWANIPTLDALPVLREAVSARTAVSFRYHDRERRVDPWGMLLRDGFWYLVGFDHGHGERRTFRVDRIEGAVEAEAGALSTFERPELDLSSVLPADPKLLGAGGEPDEATALVRLDSASNRVSDALEELGEARIEDRRDDGWVDVLVPCANPAAFRSWVLGLLDAAVVLQPLAVRDEIVSWLDAPCEIDVAAAESALQHRRSTSASPSASTSAKVAGAGIGRGRADERVRRMLLMLPWLIERGEVPLDEVAQRFHLSPQDVESDIAWVSMCGLPPYVDEMIDVFVDEGMVYMGVPRVFTRPLRLTAPEGFALLTAGRAAMALPGADQHGSLGRGLAKLAAALGDDAGTVVVDLQRPAIADDLTDAVRRVERLELVYWSAARDEVTERVVTPRRLFADRGHWYLAADDRRTGESRTFRLDRIESYRRLGEFDDPVEQSAAGEWFSDASIARATMCLRPGAFWVTERYPLDDVFETDIGGQRVRIVRLAVSDERWLARLMVRLGPDAAVIDPVEWRAVADGVRERIRARYR
ncbi:hypothetical protein BH20ACT4_BH20ACT4_10060 [soil metagenome]